MCFDPMSMAMMASTATQAVGAISAGNANAAAAKYDAKVARMNADLMNERIRDERLLAGDENRRVGEEAAAAIGQQTVGAAAGNLDIGFGSPLAALLASADAAGRDAAHVMDNNARTTRDLRQQQANYRTAAKSSDAQAKGFRRGGFLQAAGTVLGGVGNYYERSARAKIGG